MPEKPYITISAADERVRFVGSELIQALTEFNEQHVDPDAELVAESLNYVTDDDIYQMCALTLAETCIVVPEKEERSNPSQLRVSLRNRAKARKKKAERERETEVETG